MVNYANGIVMKALCAIQIRRRFHLYEALLIMNRRLLYTLLHWVLCSFLVLHFNKQQKLCELLCICTTYFIITNMLAVSIEKNSISINAGNIYNR
ncbi:hypothetical protein T4B_7177 [Trichinella pseudospiralis]|uniref:Uncharacterized protein n=1 Tax=Trichinella pseudospiralis TaxID=6337 RepID=A0A0V1IMX4_TRIPS|nr:hypothetical protein T4B_7177 [Trichinella pseudospiralis]